MRIVDGGVEVLGSGAVPVFTLLITSNLSVSFHN